jgi:hypothetical protein
MASAPRTWPATVARSRPALRGEQMRVRAANVRAGGRASGIRRTMVALAAAGLLTGLGLVPGMAAGANAAAAAGHAVTAARDGSPAPAAVANISNNTCWYITADDGVGPYLRDAGLNNATTIGDYNACFYLSANGSQYNGKPGYQMMINPHGANCEKVPYSSGPNFNKLYDEPCDDQWNGDTRETWVVSPEPPYGYLLYNVGAGSFAGVDSLGNGTVVFVGESEYPYWGLEAS